MQKMYTTQKPKPKPNVTGHIRAGTLP